MQRIYFATVHRQEFSELKIPYDTVNSNYISARRFFMARIKDIAELAGVSRGTVDRVLNNRSGVSPQTAEKIKEIAKALDYRPNKAGLALAAQKKKNKIGIVLFSRNNPFFDEVSEGVQAKARELADYGVTTLTRRVEFDLAAQLAAIDELLDEGIHGLLLAPYNHPAPASIMMTFSRVDATADQAVRGHDGCHHRGDSPYSVPHSRRAEG